MLHGQYPDGFASITFEIKSNQPIPIVRASQRHHPYPPQKDVPTYPIHQKGSKTYNLLTTLDKMQIKEHIEIKGEYNYIFAILTAQTYASVLRHKKKPIQMYLRGEWNKQEQIGRIWRIG